MTIENLGYIQYALLFLIILGASISVFLKDIKSKLTAFFITSCFVVAFAVFLFSGVFAVIVGLIFLFIFLVLYGYFKQIYFFGTDEKIENGEKEVNNISLSLAAVLCIGGGYLFYSHTFGFLESKIPVEVFTLMDYIAVIEEFFLNYFLIVILILGSLFMTLIWFILIISNSKREEECN